MLRCLVLDYRMIVRHYFFYRIKTAFAIELRQEIGRRTTNLNASEFTHF